ncbi:MAG: GGDEF domain-containing protein [Nocardioides sp.]|nr:GGDEF domain-containing protein [Nocardioides sp.]
MAGALAIEHSALRARAEAAERSARLLATQDPLTGVGNRSMLMQRLDHVASARAAQRGPLALVFIDLDDFKTINDVYSHAAGDRVLQEVAARITSTVRPHDTVVRWGGDEFVVLLEQVDDEEAGRRVTQRITEVIAEPISYSALELSVSASVGLAFDAGDDELDLDALMRRADTAMYEVKHRTTS